MHKKSPQIEFLVGEKRKYNLTFLFFLQLPYFKFMDISF